MTTPGVPPAATTARDAGTPTAVSLRAAVAEGRLHLGGLAPAARWPAILALALVAGASFAILAAALAIPLPGGTLLLPGSLVGESTPVPVPHLAIVGFLLGLAPASVAFVASALVVPRRSTRGVILVVAGVNLSLGASALAQLPLGSAVAEVDRVAAWAIAIGCGGAVAAALTLGLAGLIPPRDGLVRTASRLTTAVAGVPGVLLAATYLVGLAGSTTMPTPRPAGMESFPDVLHVGAVAVASPLYGALARTLPLVLAPIVLWEAATWARASRAELAAPVVRRVDRVPWLLVALVSAKLGWLALGYLGRLPESLGGAAAAWSLSAGRGVAAWLIAAVFAAGAAAWLAVRRSPEISERGIGPGVRFVIAGFTAGSVIGGACVVAAGILLLLPVDGPFTAAVRLGGLAGDLIQPLQVATVPAALVIGLVLLRRGHLATGGFLAVAGAWMAPRALFVLALSIGVVPPDAANPLGVDLVTLDALLSLAVAALAVALVAGRPVGVDAGGLALVLAVSTLMAHGGTLVPPGIASVLVLAAVLFPPFRELVFGSRELNEASHVRPARVLGSLGRQGAALLLVAGTRTVVGGPGEAGAQALGQLLFGPPYAALLVAVVITIRRRREGVLEIAEGAVVAGDAATLAPSDPGEPRDGGVAIDDAARQGRPMNAPEPGPAGAVLPRFGLGLATGLAGLAVAVALAGLVVDPLVGHAWQPAPSHSPGVSPAPAASLGASPTASGGMESSPSPAETAAPKALLTALVPGVNDRMTALQKIVSDRFGTPPGPALAAAADELTAAATADLAWLAEQPVAPCFLAYRDAVARHLASYRDLGIAVAAFARGAGPEAEAVRRVDEVNSSLDGVIAALDAALPACGVAVPSPSP